MKELKAYNEAKEALLWKFGLSDIDCVIDDLTEFEWTASEEKLIWYVDDAEYS